MVNRGQLIKGWGRSHNRAEQIAAALGARIASGQFSRYVDLPPVAELAEEFDVHRTTITNAKKLLGEYEFLDKVAGRWVVA